MMNYRRVFMKRLLAIALAFNVFGLSLSCVAICAEHAEPSSCVGDENKTSLNEEDEECCSLDTHRSLPPERIQKTPAGQINRHLPTAQIFVFDLYYQTLSSVKFASQPDKLPPLKRIPALLI